MAKTLATLLFAAFIAPLASGCALDAQGDVAEAPEAVDEAVGTTSSAVTSSWSCQQYARGGAGNVTLSTTPTDFRPALTDANMGTVRASSSLIFTLANESALDAVDLGGIGTLGARGTVEVELLDGGLRRVLLQRLYNVDTTPTCWSLFPLGQRVKYVRVVSTDGSGFQIADLRAIAQPGT